MKQTKLTLSMKSPDQQIPALAQLVRHWPEDPGGPWFQSPLGAIFDEFFFALPCVNNLSDNLTETPIVKNSIVVCEKVDCL